MASGGVIISGLEFVSYRVISMTINMLPTIGMLFTEISSESDWDFGVGFSEITFDPSAGFYIVPLTTTMHLLQVDGGERKTREESYISASATISGVFKFTDECTMSVELREKMIRQQAPAIVFPYLRATMSNLLISAGFGGITLPLLNIYEMARNQEPVKIVQLSPVENVVSGNTQKQQKIVE